MSNYSKALQRGCLTFLNSWSGVAIIFFTINLLLLLFINIIPYSNCSLRLGSSYFCQSSNPHYDNIGNINTANLINFEPIDAVYTWVNGSDPVWQAKRDYWKQKYNLIANSTSINKTDDDPTSSNRYRDSEELRYSIRSLVKNAPWIRHIYLVTDNQIPYWLNLETSKLSIIDHKDIFLNQSHLPVFSSPAIEANLHHIKGLSKRFLYFNDDVFLGSPVLPEDFITMAGSQKLYLAWEVPKCAPGCSDSWLGDGYCDRACNVSACGFDFPDCVNATTPITSSSSSSTLNRSVHKPHCLRGCPDSWLGDKVCDARCNNPSCGYDFGDCGYDNLMQSFPSSSIDKVIELNKDEYYYYNEKYKLTLCEFDSGELCLDIPMKTLDIEEEIEEEYEVEIPTDSSNSTSLVISNDTDSSLSSNSNTTTVIQKEKKTRLVKQIKQIKEINEEKLNEEFPISLSVPVGTPIIYFDLTEFKCNLFLKLNPNVPCNTTDTEHFTFFHSEHSDIGNNIIRDIKLLKTKNLLVVSLYYTDEEISESPLGSSLISSNSSSASFPYRVSLQVWAVAKEIKYEVAQSLNHENVTKTYSSYIYSGGTTKFSFVVTKNSNNLALNEFLPPKTNYFSLSYSFNKFYFSIFDYTEKYPENLDKGFNSLDSKLINLPVRLYDQEVQLNNFNFEKKKNDQLTLLDLISTQAALDAASQADNSTISSTSSSPIISDIDYSNKILLPLLENEISITNSSLSYMKEERANIVIYWNSSSSPFETFTDDDYSSLYVHIRYHLSDSHFYTTTLHLCEVLTFFKTVKTEDGGYSPFDLDRESICPYYYSDKEKSDNESNELRKKISLNEVLENASNSYHSYSISSISSFLSNDDPTNYQKILRKKKRIEEEKDLPIEERQKVNDDGFILSIPLPYPSHSYNTSWVELNLYLLYDPAYNYNKEKLKKTTWHVTTHEEEEEISQLPLNNRKRPSKGLPIIHHSSFFLYGNNITTSEIQTFVSSRVKEENNIEHNIVENVSRRKLINNNKKIINYSKLNFFNKVFFNFLSLFYPSIYEEVISYSLSSINFPPTELIPYNTFSGLSSFTSLSLSPSSTHISRKLLDSFGSSLINVNRVYNKAFGVEIRKTAAHVPHFINIEVMDELYNSWPEHWNITSSNRFRSQNDMQYSFAYYQYLINRGKQKNITENLAYKNNYELYKQRGDLNPDGNLEYRRKKNKEFNDKYLHKLMREAIDTNEDNYLDPNELKSLFYMLKFSSDHSKFNQTEYNTMIQCIQDASSSSNFSSLFINNLPDNSTDNSTTPTSSTIQISKEYTSPYGKFEKIINFSSYPTIEEALDCSIVRDHLISNFNWKGRFSDYSPIILNDKEDIAFEMINDDEEETLNKLNSVRQRQSKFICINDNMNNPSERLQIELKNFFLSFFPIRSYFELDENERNLSLYTDEYKILKQKEKNNILLKFKNSFNKIKNSIKNFIENNLRNFALYILHHTNNDNKKLNKEEIALLINEDLQFNPHSIGSSKSSSLFNQNSIYFVTFICYTFVFLLVIFFIKKKINKKNTPKSSSFVPSSSSLKPSSTTNLSTSSTSTFSSTSASSTFSLSHRSRSTSHLSNYSYDLNSPYLKVNDLNSSLKISAEDIKASLPPAILKPFEKESESYINTELAYDEPVEEILIREAHKDDYKQLLKMSAYYSDEDDHFHND